FGKVTNYSIDDSLPDAVGAFVEFLLRHSGWTVSEKDEDGRERRVRLEERHVCLLLKRFQAFRRDVTRGYVEALEARGIQHVLIGGRSFHQREEVLALRACVRALEWPDDEMSVFAALKGPFFALGDDVLLGWRHAVGRLHPLRRVDADAIDPALRETADAL